MLRLYHTLGAALDRSIAPLIERLERTLYPRLQPWFEDDFF